MSGDRRDEWLLGILGSLERPAMPQEVADRLDAALAAVPVQRDGAADGPVGPQPGVLPPSPRRRRGSWLAGTAGAAAALTLLIALNPDPFAGGAAQDPVVPLAEAPPPPPLAAPALEEPAGVPAPGPLAPQITVASQTSYTRQALPQQAVEVAEGAVEEQPAPTPSAMALPEIWRAAAEQPAASPAGAADCLVGLPDADLPVVFVDRAEFEGEPVLVVARRAGPQFEVHVLRASCTSEDPAVLLRATVEAP